MAARPAGRLLWRERHLRLAAARQRRCRARAVAAAHGPEVVRLAQAAAHRELAPVARVAGLLDLVRAEDRRGGPDLRDPLRLVDGAGARPRRDALLLEQADGVLAQS